MTIHQTKTGSIELIDQYGHGKAARGDWRNAPAVLVFDDNDGHYDAWKVEGSMEDAADKIAEFFECNGVNVVVFDGSRVYVETAPDDFWIETESGDFEPNTAAYPNVIGY